MYALFLYFFVERLSIFSAPCLSPNVKYCALYRKFVVSPPDPDPIDENTDIGTDHREPPCEPSDCPEKVSKQDGDTIRLDNEADEGPP